MKGTVNRMAETLDSARSAAASLGKSLINGEWIAGQEDRQIEIFDPATADVIGHMSVCSVEDVDRAVAAARLAFEVGPWGQLKPAERAKILWRVADLMDEHQDELAALETLDCGKPLMYSRLVDVAMSAEIFRYMAGAVTKIEGATVPLSSAGSWHAYTKREPLGVVAAITPWNFPLLLAVMKIAPALAAGNVVILKPSEWTPLSSLKLGELMVDAGIPDGVFQIVTGDGAGAGDALVRHHGVNKIAFTGSTAVGRRIGAIAGEQLKPVTLELGGKSANIIFPDADIPAAIAGAAAAIFYNAGQNCMAASRLFVHSSIHDEVVTGLAEHARALVVGAGHEDATEMGPMVSDVHLAKVVGYIESAKEQGATIAAGGHVLDRAGYFVAPTIVSAVTPDMKIAQEEIFGPVLSVMPFDDEDEVVAMANASEYGLAAGLWTTNVRTAHRVADRLRGGNVFVNCWGGADAAMPFGGMKASGLGRENGKEAIDSYVETKSVYIPID